MKKLLIFTFLLCGFLSITASENTTSQLIDTNSEFTQQKAVLISFTQQHLSQVISSYTEDNNADNIYESMKQIQEKLLFSPLDFTFFCSMLLKHGYLKEQLLQLDSTVRSECIFEIFLALETICTEALQSDLEALEESVIDTINTPATTTQTTLEK